MEKDYRADFIRKSSVMADGESVKNSSQHGKTILDTKDLRERFIISSQALANGKSMADVKKMYTDAVEKQIEESSLDYREKFKIKSQIFSDSETVYEIDLGRTNNGETGQQFHASAYRIGISDVPIRMKDVMQDEKSPRDDLLKKLAAM